MSLYVVDVGSRNYENDPIAYRYTKRHARDNTAPMVHAGCDTVPHTGLPMRAWRAHPHVSQVLALRPEWPIHGLPVCAVHYCSASRLNRNRQNQSKRSDWEVVLHCPAYLHICEKLFASRARAGTSMKDRVISLEDIRCSMQQQGGGFIEGMVLWAIAWKRT